MLRTRTALLMTLLLLMPLSAAAKGPGGGETELSGNNLSMPVIWSDGVSIALRGTFGAPVFTGAAFPTDCQALGVECWYLQQDQYNTWQAETATATPATTGPVDVDWIDWGDNLESKDWTATSIVRVEVGLWKDLATPMLAFTMAHLWGSGTDEMWGANTTTYDSLASLIYSRTARLTIQKLTKDRSDPSLTLTWNPSLAQWEGDASAPVFNGGVWQTGTGRSGAYSAEINVSGKVIYGYNWNVRTTGSGAGCYRLTFSLDGVNAPVVLNTFFTDGITQIMGSTEGEITEEPTAGGIAVIDYDNNLTYMDVKILPGKGRRK